MNKEGPYISLLVGKLNGIWRLVMKSKTTSVLGVMASVSMSSSLIMALSGLLIARWVSPETMGIVRKFSIPTGYAAIMLILVSDGFRREYPYLIGCGNRAEALALAGVTKAWYLLCTVIMCLVFAVLGMFSLLQRNWVDFAGWSTQIFLVIMAFYGSYLATIYRRSLEFKQLSYNGLTSTIVGVFCLPLVKLLGYYGVMLRQIVVSIVGLWMNMKHLPEKITMLWDRKRFSRLVSISIPLASIGYVKTSFIDSTFNYIVLLNCGESALGLYGIAATFQGFAMHFVSAVSQVFDVKVANKYGECNSIRKSLRYLAYPTVLNFAASLFFASCLCVFVGPFIKIVLPKYIDAIPVVRLLSINMLLSALGLPTRILNVALEYKAMAVSAAARVLTVVVLLLVVPHTISWCAFCVLLGNCADLATEYWFLFRLARAS